MGLLDKLFGKKKTKYEFVGEAVKYLKGKRGSDGGYYDELIFNIGFVYDRSYDSSGVQYQIDFSGSTVLEYELQKKIIDDMIRNDHPVGRYVKTSLTSAAFTGEKLGYEWSFAVSEFEVPFINVEKFCETLYSTVKRYEGLRKKYGKVIDGFARMESAQDEKIKILESGVEKAKDEMNSELKRKARELMGNLYEVDGTW